MTDAEKAVKQIMPNLSDASVADIATIAIRDIHDSTWSVEDYVDYLVENLDYMLNDLEPETRNELRKFEVINSNRRTNMKTIKSDSNWNKRIQEIMDEEGVTRKEAERILAGECTTSSRTIKSEFEVGDEVVVNDEGKDLNEVEGTVTDIVEDKAEVVFKSGEDAWVDLDKIESAKKPIKSMAAVSRDKLMDWNSLRNMAKRMFEQFGYECEEQNYGLYVPGWGFFNLSAQKVDKTNQTVGRYSIDAEASTFYSKEARPDDAEADRLFGKLGDTYYEGSNTAEFQEDMKDLIDQMDEVKLMIHGGDAVAANQYGFELRDDDYVYDNQGHFWYLGDWMNDVAEPYADFDAAMEDMIKGIKDAGYDEEIDDVDDYAYQFTAFAQSKVPNYIKSSVTSGCHGKDKKKKKAIKSDWMSGSPTQMTAAAKDTYDAIKMMLDAVDDGMDVSNRNCLEFLKGLDNPMADEVLMPYAFSIWEFNHKDGTPWSEDEINHILDENNGLLV